MKKIALSFHYITLILICQVLAIFHPCYTAFASTYDSDSENYSTITYDANDFYFKNFTADYYVTRDAEGISHMRVHEKLTAVFPDYDQNHGITRSIPYTNDAGNNVTIDSESALDLKVTRNGAPENVAQIEKENNAYFIRIGSASSYVHGTQVYELDYNFDRPILSYTSAGFTTYDTDNTHHQELYWDTNGTGWSQKFKSLTARVHFEKDVLKNIFGEPSCYVGRQGATNAYGKNISDRCEVTETSDGYKFTVVSSASGSVEPEYMLSSGENLTFDIGFKPGTFVTPIVYNYSLLILSIIIFVILTVIVLLAVKSRRKYSEKRNFYKNSPVPPQYIPAKDLSIAESALLMTKNAKSDRVAVLLDLAVRKKISLEKGDKKVFGGYKWKVNVLDVSDLKREEQIVLEILNHGADVSAGTVIEVKRQSYSPTVEALNKIFASNAKKNLKSKGYFEDTKDSFFSISTSGSTSSASSNLITKIILICVFGPIVFTFIIPFLIFFVEDTSGVVYGGEIFGPLCVILGIACFVAPSVITRDNHIYKTRTKKGLEAAIYLDGLYLYMKMAESDRINFLQSVDGADTSPNGIVKLYERLLPYAVLFGIENSWLSELSRYYEMPEVADSGWYIGPGPFVFSDLHAFSSAASSSISSGSIDPSSSSSSGSSGGGGGGSSGGGGGGGGGGGW